MYLLFGSYGRPVGSSSYDIGTWPTLTGNDIVSLPLGLTFPNSTFATAVPPVVPGYHASSIAGAPPACVVGSPPSSGIVSGRPFISTTTYGVPVAATCWISASCCPGRSRLVREDASPESPAGSPTTITVTAEFFAADTADPKSVLSLQGSVTVKLAHPSA